jgi:hypothetical protein
MKLIGYEQNGEQYYFGQSGGEFYISDRQDSQDPRVNMLRVDIASIGILRAIEVFKKYLKEKQDAHSRNEEGVQLFG